MNIRIPIFLLVAGLTACRTTTAPEVAFPPPAPHTKQEPPQATNQRGAPGEKGAEKEVKASYYGDGFEGKKTASGERFNKNEMTAAHPSLPMGSKVKVENPDTGKEVTVKINDRGPHKGGRQLDLSEGAAEQLGMKQTGVDNVEMKVVERPEKEKERVAKK